MTNTHGSSTAGSLSGGTYTPVQWDMTVSVGSVVIENLQIDFTTSATYVLKIDGVTIDTKTGTAVNFVVNTLLGVGTHIFLIEPSVTVKVRFISLPVTYTAPGYSMALGSWTAFPGSYTISATYLVHAFAIPIIYARLFDPLPQITIDKTSFSQIHRGVLYTQPVKLFRLDAPLVPIPPVVGQIWPRGMVGPNYRVPNIPGTVRLFNFSQEVKDPLPTIGQLWPRGDFIPSEKI